MRFTLTTLMIILAILTLIACGGTSESLVEEAPAAPTTAVVAEESAQAPAEPTPAIPAEEPTEAAAPTAEPTSAAVESNPEIEAMVRTFRLVPETSQASYAVEEEFFNQPVSFVTAVGTTSEIEGEFTLMIAGNQVNLGENHFVVDLSTLTSDSSRRDNRIRDSWLESSTYPLAEFTATSLENFPAEAAEGQDVSFDIVGDMTIREVTKPVTFETTARLDGDTFTGIATTYLLMRDFGFEPPSILGMLEVTDGVTVTFEFTATEVGSSS